MYEETKLAPPCMAQGFLEGGLEACHLAFSTGHLCASSPHPHLHLQCDMVTTASALESGLYLVLPV